MQRSTTAHEVERAILSRIASSHYGIGDRLPTCEQFGRELGANKNTVSKAYQALGRRGYLTSRAGRGTFVLRRARDVRRQDAMTEVRKLLTYTAEQADMAGLSRAELESLAAEVVSTYFDALELNVGYIDCNRPDANELSRELQLVADIPVDPLLLDDVLRDIDEIAERYKILGVELAHLQAVEQALSHVSLAKVPDIVPILALPDPASLASIARLKSGTRLLVVSDMPDMLSAQVGLVRALNPNLAVSESLFRDPGLTELVDAADVILGNRRLRGLSVGIPVIEVSYRLDERSAGPFSERVTAYKRGAVSVDSSQLPSEAAPAVGR